MLPGIRIIPGIIGSRCLVERTAHAWQRAKNGTDSHSAKNHAEKWRPCVHKRHRLPSPSLAAVPSLEPLTITPRGVLPMSSVAAERVFSVLKRSFSDTQYGSLQDLKSKLQ